MDMEALNRRILNAHRRRDEESLAFLYAEAAAHLDQTGRTDEACFFAVNAYALALSTGCAAAAGLRDYLRRHDREA